MRFMSKQSFHKAVSVDNKRKELILAVDHVHAGDPEDQYLGLTKSINQR